jgi:hypothetical protein
LLDSLINRVDEHIRVIKSLSPSSFTLDNLYNELVVMAIIWVLPQSFDDIVRTISILDKFEKASVVQSLRNMDQTRNNLASTSSMFAASLAFTQTTTKVIIIVHTIIFFIIIIIINNLLLYLSASYRVPQGPLCTCELQLTGNCVSLYGIQSRGVRGTCRESYVTITNRDRHFL